MTDSELRRMRRVPVLGDLMERAWAWDAENKLRRIGPFSTPGSAVLDLGSGPGTVARRLLRRGYRVECVDVADRSWFPETRPRLYDGLSLPYRDRRFDEVLLLTVLHHCREPERVLREAGRVGRRVIVIEDVYRSTPQRWLTCGMDSLVNLELAGHPHENRTDREWRRTFRRLGFTLRHAHDYRFLLLFRQAVYVLEPHGVAAPLADTGRDRGGGGDPTPGTFPVVGDVPGEGGQGILRHRHGMRLIGPLAEATEAFLAVLDRWTLADGDYGGWPTSISRRLSAPGSMWTGR
jgi:SAM-dependent methyltransferase